MQLVGLIVTGWLAGAITFGLVAGLMPWQGDNDQGVQGDRSFSRNEVVFKLQDENGPEVVGLDEVGNLDLDVTITVDFPNEDVKTIIANVAELYGLNVMMPEDLKGRTTLKLKDVTWQQVFDVTLDPLGYGYHIDGNIIKILRQEQLDDISETVVRFINYADAEQVAESLSPYLSKRKGNLVKVDTRTNALIITANPFTLSRIDELIQSVDRPPNQIKIEAKIFEITEHQQTANGLDWAGFDSDRQFAMGFECFMKAAFGLGSLSGIDTGADLETRLERILEADGTVLDPEAFEKVLKSFDPQTNARMVANPSVVVLDGKTASISSVDRLSAACANPRSNAHEDSAVANRADDDAMLTALSVSPELNNAGFIKLKIHSEFSYCATDAVWGGVAAFDQPNTIRSKSLSSEVILKDGYTIIAGVLSENSTLTQSVPYLTQNPYLDALTKNPVTMTSKRRWILFVTARILNPDGCSYQDIIDVETLQTMGIIEHDIP